MSKTEWEEKCLEYHIGGKTGTLLKKPCDTAEELSMAYTPGVAVPCLEIEKDVWNSSFGTWRYRTSCRKACNGRQRSVI